MNDDCISRQAVLECFTWTNDKADIWNRIKELPPVTPQPKTGHWIYKQYGGYPECGNWHCSECDEIDNRTSAHCPHCGCRMVEPQESEAT